MSFHFFRGLESLTQRPGLALIQLHVYAIPPHVVKQRPLRSVVDSSFELVFDSVNINILWLVVQSVDRSTLVWFLRYPPGMS